MIALRRAIDGGAERIDIRCALGGRLDHLLGNLQAAVFAAKRGIRVRISDERTRLLVLPPCALNIERLEGFSLSLLSAADICEGVCISGVKYPLSNAVVTNSFPIGLSNEWLESSARLSFTSGMLLVVMSRL